MKASSQPHSSTVFNGRMPTGMEIVDLEREEDWLDLMSTTLTFVCLALLPFDRIDQVRRPRYLPVS